MRAALVLAFALSLTGCLGAMRVAGLDACPAPAFTLLTGPAEAAGVARAPGEPVPMLFWARNEGAANATFASTPLPVPEGALDPRDPTRAPDAAGLVQRVGPGGLAWGGFAQESDLGESIVFQVERLADDCRPSGVAASTLALAPAQERPVGAEGQGILVRTGGFWVNGTSFYTNHAGIDADELIPKGYLGEYGGDEPLKVYVYAEGETVPPKRYQDAGYVMTIPGFNAALKGLPVGTARFAYLEPEDAYTREGREDHPLYGDALVFWIEAVELVDEPCLAPAGPVCDLPGVPPLPVPPILE